MLEELVKKEKKPLGSSNAITNWFNGGTGASRRQPQRSGPTQASGAAGTTATRDTLQQEAVELLIKEKNLILEWGTGVGKSRVAILAYRALLYAGYRKVLLLVAEKDHKRNWREEFVKCLGKEGEVIFNDLVVECYQSIKKYNGTEWDLIIADEAHHLRSDKRLEDLSTMKAAHVLCISATMDDGGDGEKLIETLSATFGPFVRRSFSVQQGIDNGFIGKPKIFVHLLPFSKIVQEQETVIRWGYPKGRVRLDCTVKELDDIRKDRETFPSAEVHVHGSAEDLYLLLSSEIEQADRRKSDLDKKLYGSQRKALLGHCKTHFVQWLLMSMKDKRYVCFCTDIDQGNELGATTVVNSQRKSRGNEELISSFNAGKIDHLFAIGMMKEGTNLKDIQCGVIVQLGNKERDFIQKFGRTLRADSPEQHLVVVRNSKDEEFFVNSVDSLDKRNIKIVKY